MSFLGFLDKRCKDASQKRLVKSFFIYSVLILLIILVLLVEFFNRLQANITNGNSWYEGGIYLFLACLIVPFFILSMINLILSIKQKYSTYMIVISIILCFGFFPIGAIILIPCLNILTNIVWDISENKVGLYVNKRLKNLSSWYFIIAAMVTIGLLILLIYTGVDIFYYNEYGSSKEGAYIGFFEALGVGLGLIIAFVNAAVSLRKKKNWQFLISFAGILCFFIPLGTILGVLTLKTLKQTHVKRLFNK